jgi:hypothetical protein
VFPNTLEFVALNQRVNKFEYQWPDCLGCTRLVAPITLSNGATTVPLNLRDGVVTEKPEKGIKDTDPLIHVVEPDGIGNDIGWGAPSRNR